MLVLLASCGLTGAPEAVPQPVMHPPRLPERRPEIRPITGPGAARVQHLLDSLSLRDKVAQLVMPWIAGGYEPIDGAEMRQALMWVDSLKVGGIIMSIGSPTEIAAKLNALQRAAPLPLLVASDLEGGTTLRFVGGTAFPTQMGIGAGGREDDAYQMGRITALEGRAVGIHLAFAPVADVNSNPNNPIINTRSFGGDPQVVARFVAATIRGIRDNGMFATAKHFPGHGDTETDSHLSLPTITAGWTRFDTLELVPFRAAIAAGVDAVMSAHIALPALDPGQNRPGTLSPPILTGILRDSLHFTGLITTDALNMGAIVKEVGADEAPVLAFLAGSDLLLMPTDAGRAIDAMVRAVETGRITRERVDQSVRRILEMKERLGLFQQREVDLNHIAAVVGQAEFRRIGAETTQRSITLLKDSLGTVEQLRAQAAEPHSGRDGRDGHHPGSHARERIAPQGLHRAANDAAVASGFRRARLRAATHRSRDRRADRRIGAGQLGQGHDRTAGWSGAGDQHDRCAATHGAHFLRLAVPDFTGARGAVLPARVDGDHGE